MSLILCHFELPTILHIAQKFQLRISTTLNPELQSLDGDSFSNPYKLENDAKWLKKQGIALKLGQIIVFNKRKKVMCSVFVFDFIITSLFHHVTSWHHYCEVIRNDIFAHESEKCSEYGKFTLFLKQIHLKYSETLFKTYVTQSCISWIVFNSFTIFASQSNWDIRWPQTQHPILSSFPVLFFSSLWLSFNNWSIKLSIVRCKKSRTYKNIFSIQML